MNPNAASVTELQRESALRSPALPPAPLREGLSCGFASGAVAGAVVGLADAALAGVGGFVFTYSAAVGLAAGGLFGGLFGLVAGAATRARPGAGTTGAAVVPPGGTVLAVAALILALVLPDAVGLFARAFRNRDLAALTLAVATLGGFLVALAVGAGVRGVAERIAARRASQQAARLLRAVPLVAWFACAAVAALQVLRTRASLDAEDARAAGLALCGLALAMVAYLWLRRRAFRFARLPYLPRRAALVTSLGALYATYQMMTGSAPTTIKQARAALVLTALALPAPDSDSAAPPDVSSKVGKATGDKAPPSASDEARAVADTPSPAPTAQTPPSGQTPPPRPSLLFVTLSSTRADRMSLHGYARPTTPKLDAFAKRCTVFERAYAGASSERDAMHALMSGRLVSQLRRSTGPWPRVRPKQRLLAEVLSGAGYHASAVVSHDALRREGGLNAGFASYDTTLAKAGERTVIRGESAPAVTHKASALLAAAPADKPFLLWAHYSDAHARYLPHPVAANRGADGGVAEPQTANVDGGATGLLKRAPRKRGRNKVVGLFGNRPADLYDGELAFVDEHLGPLLATADGSARKPWVIIVGDHGESLGEGGRRGHGSSVVEAEIRVPLVVCGEGVRAQRVEAPVSVLDLYPTLAALAGATTPAGLPGRSLVPVLLGQARAEDERAIVMENSSPSPAKLGTAALVSGHEKLVSMGAGNFPRLFDLRADPAERRNLARQRPERVRKLQIALGHIRTPSLQGAPPPPAGKGRRRVISAAEDAAEREALKRTQERKQRMWTTP